MGKRKAGAIETTTTVIVEGKAKKKAKNQAKTTRKTRVNEE